MTKDYYTFGAPMPGRQYNSSSYRYSVNGQEKTDEISGAGNHTTALYWEYDTRLGRRWNRDPKGRPEESSYACFGDNPIMNNDVNGDFVSGFTGSLLSDGIEGNLGKEGKEFGFNLYQFHGAYYGFRKLIDMPVLGFVTNAFGEVTKTGLHQPGIFGASPYSSSYFSNYGHLTSATFDGFGEATPEFSTILILSIFKK